MSINENITNIHHFMKCNECMLMLLKERNEEINKRKKKKLGKNTSIEGANNPKSFSTLNNTSKMHYIFCN